MYAAAEALFGAWRWADCYRVTSRSVQSSSAQLTAMASMLKWSMIGQDPGLARHACPDAPAPSDLHVPPLPHPRRSLRPRARPHRTLSRRACKLVRGRAVVFCAGEVGRVSSVLFVSVAAACHEGRADARNLCRKAAMLDTRFAPAWFGFGHSLALEGEHDQAITAYSTAQHHFQGSVRCRPLVTRRSFLGPTIQDTPAAAVHRNAARLARQHSLGGRVP